MVSNIININSILLSVNNVFIIFCNLNIIFFCFLFNCFFRYIFASQKLINTYS